MEPIFPCRWTYCCYIRLWSANVALLMSGNFPTRRASAWNINISSCIVLKWLPRGWIVRINSVCQCPPQVMDSKPKIREGTIFFFLTLAFTKYCRWILFAEPNLCHSQWPAASRCSPSTVCHAPFGLLLLTLAPDEGNRISLRSFEIWRGEKNGC